MATTKKEPTQFTKHLQEQEDTAGIQQYSDWYGFDTENDETGKVTLTCLIHESGERWIWKSAGCFVEWCERQEGKPVVICHNLEYDLVNEFGDRYMNMQLNYLRGRLIFAKYKNVTFLDSFNHFRMSLKNLGEALGIKKLEMDIYSDEYVATDAWICLKAMTGARDYIASLGGRIGATSGSSAVSVWRYMTDSEFCNGPFDNQWLRKGYYGGRTEIFRVRAEGKLLGKSPEGEEIREKSIRGYDVNSMYPFCMLLGYPEYYVDDAGFEKEKGMAEVTIKVPEDTFVAILPYRDPDSSRLLYPVGVFKGVWTYDEIRMAEKNGAKILEVHQAVGCNTVIQPFGQFITTLYEKRKNSKSESERLFLKVMMNSLYGKLATRSEITRVVSRYGLLKKESKRIDEVKWINYHRGLLTYNTPPQPYVNVLWGAMVTAYSRMVLTSHLLKVPTEQLIYCDTDSVYCKDYEFPISNELGGMKLEKTASLMVVHQPKAYQLDSEFKAKGVPRPKYDAKGNILVNYARQYIEDGITHFQAPIRFRASIDSKRGKANQWVPHSKSMTSPYESKILSNGRYFPPVIGLQGELPLQIIKPRVKKKK